MVILAMIRWWIKYKYYDGEGWGQNADCSVFVGSALWGQQFRYLSIDLVSNIPVVVTSDKNYSSTDPTWVTSPFFRAGQESVISSYTGSSQYPFAAYTFTFSSALPGVPNLAYGIQKYYGTCDIEHRKRLFWWGVLRDKADGKNCCYFFGLDSDLRVDKLVDLGCCLHRGRSYFPASLEFFR